MDKSINYLKSILKPNSVVVIACSGGPDSMCLLYLLKCLKEEFNLKVIVAHVNHLVREESTEEAEFVRNVVKQYNMIFEYYELKNKYTSNFHSRSREERYAFFEELVRKYKASYLMSAHHGDDLIETILMRICRGSNLKGYSGFDILSLKDNYVVVKPLIFYSKSYILDYMRDNNLEYRLDYTNDLNDYPRVRFRHKVLPLLYEENKNINDRFLKYNNVLSEADNFINNYLHNIIDKIYNNNVLDISLFKKEDVYIQKRIIEYILSTIYIKDLYLVKDSNIDEILKIINSNKPNISLNLPNNHIIIKNYNKLLVDKRKVINKKVSSKVLYEDNNCIIDYSTDNTDNSNYSIRLLSKEIKMPLIIHKRNNGDKMHILHFNGTKKVKDILIDSKVPIETRNNLPIVYDSNNIVLWLPGIKKSKFAKEINEKYDIILKYTKKGE